MASSRYKYDIHFGHYVPLFEGEAPQTDGTEDQTNTENGDQKQQPTAAVVNLNSPDVIKMQQEKTNVINTLQTNIKNKSDNIIQIQQKITSTIQDGKSDQATVNALYKSVIQAQKELADAKFEIAKKTNEYDNKIFQLQSSLVESTIKAYNELPQKYTMLNESNVQNAKIYIGKIFDNDYQQRIKGMIDFKKAFANSNLLYGKDKKGYFAVCVDQEDLNKLTNTLIEIGYNKDDIYSVVLSQMFDRSDLVKN